LHRLLFAGASILLAGPACAQLGQEPSPQERMFASKRSEQLYLSAANAKRLFVEVDAVEGFQDVDACIADLRACLETWCDKPDGITLSLGDPLPDSVTRGRSREVLAIEQMGGLPAGEDGTRNAYLYVLLDDSELSGLKPYNPNVRGDYRCAVFYDAAYVRERAQAFADADPAGAPWDDHLRRECLLHELGHCLGLVRAAEHGEETHCTELTCRSAAVVSLANAGDWCAACRSDLAHFRADAEPQPLAFHGALLVRAETGYWVSHLPGFSAVTFLSPFEKEWPVWRSEALETVSSEGDADNAHCMVYFDGPPPSELIQAVRRAQADPDPLVSDQAAAAVAALERLERGRGSK
jgi:hypothetical protein